MADLFSQAISNEGTGKICRRLLKRFWEQLNSYSDSVVLGYASVPDMRAVLKDEMGIEFTGFGGHENG